MIEALIFLAVYFIGFPFAYIVCKVVDKEDRYLAMIFSWSAVFLFGAIGVADFLRNKGND